MTIDDLVSELSISEVHAHLRHRMQIIVDLRQHLQEGAVDGFVRLALGITDPAGNYSASEHRLGPRILSENSPQDIFELAASIDECGHPHHLPKLIYDSGLSYLKISVGSEIAMMLQPTRFWVGNKRTYWTHLLLKHAGSVSRANDELKLFHDDERESEMDYAIWRDLYLAIQPSLDALSTVTSEAAETQGLERGAAGYVWPDAAASFLFDRYANVWS